MKKVHWGTWTIVGLSLAFVAALGYGFYGEVKRQLVSGNEFEQVARTRYGQTQIKGQAATEKPSVDDDPSLGPTDAPVTIIAFEDFECPYCGEVWRTEKQILQEYDGKVHFVFRDFPISSLHPHAEQAAEAAGCADDQGKFWAMHDQLFILQKNLNADSVVTAAEHSGLDMTEFTKCIQSGIHSTEIAADYAAGERAGVSGTPTYYFNGIQVQGALPIETFRTAINYFLSKSL